MMKWLKKKLQHWFFNDDIDEEIDDLEDKGEEKVNQINENHQPKFRFPLMTDDEQPVKEHVANHMQQQSNSVQNSFQPIDRSSMYSQVYDVEISRIHELLEQRRKQKGSRVTPSITNSKLAERAFSKELKRETQHKFKENKIKQESLPTNTRKRPFTPTDVPSPVFGFQKPKSIEELLSSKQKASESEQLEKSNTHLHSHVIDSKEVNDAKDEVASSVMIEEMNEKIDQVKEEVQKIIEQPIEEVSITLERIQPEIEQENENSTTKNDELQPQTQNPMVQEEHEPTTPIFQNVDDSHKLLNGESSQTPALQRQEKETVLTDTLSLDEDNDLNDSISMSEETRNVESINPFKNDIEQKETTTDKSDEDQSEEQTLVQVESTINDEISVEKPVEKEKPIPFNVIMLKSDKEKLAARLKNQQDFLKPKGTLNFSKEDSILKDFQKQEKEQKQIELQNHGQQVHVELSLSEREQQIQINSTEQDGEAHVVFQQEEMQGLKEQHLEEELQQRLPNYVKPSIEYLTPPEEATEDREWLESQADILVESLSHFQVNANVESIMQGPAVTQFEITVGHGTKVSKIRNLADDLKLALAARDIRIQAPIPGKNTIGIEIPNRISRAVRLSEVVSSDSFIESESPLEAALGLDLTGKPVTIDLRKMPHGMIAGATGSGKSVCINSILVSLLLKSQPSELKLMLIDPKMVELAPFNHIPHLVSPVITDVKAATAALKWAVDEMERRYQLFAHAGVRDLPRYNKLVEKERKFSLKLPYILIVIDELADLMMMAPQDVEESICRIAQKARACGIHLIIATQRPSVDVITGLIKSNIPTRIAFAVSSQVDSRTILDSQGAERLLGRGDMLYLGNGMTGPIRLQGTYVTDDEIEAIVEHVKEQGEPQYFFEQEELLKKAEMIEEQDELFEEVCHFVFEQGTASTSSIQRKYHIGYNRAARLIEMLESYGFVSEQKGSKPRDVYITESDLEEMFGSKM